MAAGALVQTPKKQQGLALLILVMAIILAASSYFISGLSINQVRAEQQKQTMLALKKAKQALLAYAMNYPDMPGVASTQGPGNFPCPAELDGIQKAVGAIGAGVSCNAAAGIGDGAIGRFPWATLDMEELFDGSGEHLWYAVSKDFSAIANKKVNTSTTGQITIKSNDGGLYIDGNSIDGVVAIIIAPGEPIVREDGYVQARGTDTERKDAKNYLDIAYDGTLKEEDNSSFTNSDSDDGFITGPIRNSENDIIVNDQFVVITYEEVMELVHARVGEEISDVINTYFSNCGVYPEASTFDPTKALFDSAAQGSTLELREGHLPLDTALPVNWGDVCSQPLAPVVSAPVPPQWLAAEEWHKVTYYEFSYTNPLYPYPALPAVAPIGIDCTQGVDCLTVNGADAPVNNKEALIVFSQRDITAGPNRPSAQTSDYFEGENDDLVLDGLIYDSGQIEDYVRVIVP